MRYTTLGTSGLIVSRLALGTMTFGEGRLMREVVNDVGQQAASRMVHAALDAGVNLFDTADAYTGGQAEQMLGKALQGRRDQAVIATKAGFRTGEALGDRGLSHRHLVAACEQSLGRLGTDWIDVFLLHVPDPWTPLEETARACEDLVRRGLVRYVGYSNHPAWQAQKLLDLQAGHGWAKLVTAQLYYSLAGRDIEFESVPFLAANELGLMVWAPLASGLLTGKYRDRAGRGRLEHSSFPPVSPDLASRAVEALAQVAGAHQATHAQVAIAWLLHRAFVSSVIIGARRPDQLQDNLGAAGLTLTGEEIAALDEATAPAAPYPFWPELSGRDPRVMDALG